MSETIHIYHTNDIHSHFQYWPAIKNFLKERKRWHEEEGDVCLILDVGDHIDRFHPFTEGTTGKGNIEMLNEACYDAVTIGNNEGITLSKAELNDLYRQADFDVVVANLLNPDGTPPEWAVPSIIKETPEGTKIGIVGATAEFTPFYKKLGWTIIDAKESIIQAAKEIREQVDLLVCLSHLGVKEDEYLAELCPDLDIILGAHTHHIFHKGKWIGDTLLGAAGKAGNYVGHIIVETDPHKMSAYLIDTSSLLNPDPLYDERLAAIGKTQMSETEFFNEQLMTADWFKGTRMAELFGEALIEFSNADCAMFNAGIFMGDLPQGKTTRYDFHRVLPHPINPCMIDLTGAELKEIYLQSLNPEWPQLELKGLGFRGAVFGKIMHSNMDMENHRLFINGEPALPHKNYRLITLDMFTFGYFFPSLKRANKTYFMPEFIRDVFRLYFRTKAIK
ncbi:MAG TPA: bifunctional UDP-sugar hydrolase/5'-nucleotidase [Planococcus sp. (in: firmicutes)]|nr:bifunctional UDP-sugar hydrolase/5'-nucleotidase [Planococcus sp. (in: firmicutes)]